MSTADLATPPPSRYTASAPPRFAIHPWLPAPRMPRPVVPDALARGARAMATLAALTLCGHRSCRRMATCTSRLPPPPARSPGSRDDAALYLARGELYRAHHDTTPALADYATALRLNPTLDAAHLARGRLLMEANRAAEALPDLDRFLARRPDHADALVVRARARAAVGDAPHARADYDRALSLAPNPDWFIERARLVRPSAGPAAAIDGLDEGLARLGPLLTLTLEAIDCELSLGHHDAALARLDRLVAASGPHPQWTLHRGDILLAAGRQKDARDAFSTALDEHRRPSAGAAAHASERSVACTCDVSTRSPGHHDKESMTLQASPGTSRIWLTPVSLIRVAALLAVSAISPSPMQAQQSVLVPAGAVWKYLDTGADQGTAWRAPAFNDSGLEDGRRGAGLRRRRRSHARGIWPEQQREIHHARTSATPSPWPTRPPTAASRCACCGTTAPSSISMARRSSAPTCRPARVTAATFASSVVLDANERDLRHRGRQSRAARSRDQRAGRRDPPVGRDQQRHQLQPRAHVGGAP